MAAANSQNLPEIFVPEDAKWASRAVPWTGRDEVLAQMDRTNALVTPDIAAAQNVHLLDPT